MAEKKYHPSRKDEVKFRRMRTDPKSWAQRAKAYLEKNLDNFVQDKGWEVDLTPDEYTFHFMMDASRARYTKATIKQLDGILNDEKINHGHVITADMRVKWACEYLAGVRKY